MKLSQLKSSLKGLETINFQLPNGKLVPSHFHITEVGHLSKKLVDCGQTIRNEDTISLQLWVSVDYTHRLDSENLIKLIEYSEKVLNLEDLEIEVEYQNKTIQKFGLDFDGKSFLLTNKHTSCKALENKIGSFLTKFKCC